jgi:hypothetical protein
VTETPAHYPGPDTLCEACGYALKGLRAEGACPECGLAIAESSPDIRTGPAWQARTTPANALRVAIDLASGPHRFFRTMRADGSNVPPRLFLLLVATLIGLGWYLAVAAFSRTSPFWAVVQGLIVCDSVILLSYIEALGVVYFSRRRGWRVPVRLAERLACYSAIGWVPAAALMWGAIRLVANGSIDHWMRRLLSAWEPWQSLALLVLVAAIAMLWFEVLVWIGVRQTRHANS